MSQRSYKRTFCKKRADDVSRNAMETCTITMCVESFLTVSKKMSFAIREGLFINFVIVVVTSTFVQTQLLLIKIAIPLFRLFCYSLFILNRRAHAKC